MWPCAHLTDRLQPTIAEKWTLPSVSQPKWKCVVKEENCPELLTRSSYDSYPGHK
jgi:hypothetical protein